MATHIGIGFSQEVNTALAATKAASQAQEQIQQDNIDLVIILSTIHYSPLEALLSVRKILNPLRLVGSSAAGIILAELISLRGIAVLAISSDEINFGICAATSLDTQDPREAGNSLARNAIADLDQPRRQAFIFFIDGLIKNNSPILKSIQEVFGNIFPIVGAGSTDDFHFRKTFQYYQDRYLVNSAVGLILDSATIRVGLGNKHGWKPLGKPRFITHVEGNIIRTIDHKKASGLYEEYFGEEAQSLRSAPMSRLAILYPLGIRLADEHEYLLRNPVSVLHDGSVVCQGEVPEQAQVHLMIGNKDACRQAAMNAAKEVKEGLGGKTPKLIFIFEDLGRQKLMGRGAFAEVTLIKQILGYDVPLIGMYCHGTISPFRTSQSIHRTHLQNENIVVMAIG